MRRLVLSGLALSVALIATPQARAEGGYGEWCRVGRDVGGRDCSFHTFAQCAASTERLNGGGCYANGNARSNAAPAAVRAPRRKPRTESSYR